MAVKVQFEIGHISKLRTKKTPEGFTHDWELYVQGVNKVDISSFVDKIVFNLHKTFPKPKRVLKEPPYIIQESGYAGFLLPIDIYFRNREEPKKFEFTYDLHLQRMGPPHEHSEIKNFIFENPSDEFRQKLLKGGGVPVAGVLSVGGAANTQSSADEGMVSKPKLSIDSVTKKHKSRTDEAKMNTFADLFGTPITTANSAKHSPDNRIHSAGAKGGGNPATNSNSSNNHGNPKDKPHKERDKNSSNQIMPGNSEKIRDKAEKKEKYKQSSPYKDQRSDIKNAPNIKENSKHERRAEEKSKKDKSRDKERERSREKGGNNMKRTLSPKGGSRSVNQPSPKRMTPPSSSSRTSVAGSEESRSASTKMEIEPKVKESKSKEASSNSSSKKSKKEKKDKDKDRDRDKERRDDYKHRMEGKVKDDKAGMIVGTATSSSLGMDGKDAKATPPRNSGSSKKNEKDFKLESSKIKALEKGNEREAGSTAGSTPTNVPVDKRSSNSGSTVEKEKKSHKHKKKEKTKDKDRERDREREKEKDKFNKEREKDKMEEKISEKPVHLTSGDPNNLEVNNAHQAVANANSVGSAATKKPQNKEKKSKDKVKENKRSGDVDGKPAKNATNSTRSIPSSSTSTHSNNLEISDIDSPRSLQDSVATPLATPASAQSASAQYSDSSNSSFPDISSKSASSGSLLPPPTVPTKSNTASPSTKESRASSKEQKQRNIEKNQKSMADSADKLDKIEKDNKKRRRNSTVVSAFIEPPVKQTKKDQQAKIAREKSKSPLLRAGPGGNAENGSSTFLQPSSNAATASSTPSPINTPSTTPINSNSSNVPLASPNLSTDVLNNNTNNMVHTTTSVSIISGNSNAAPPVSQTNSNVNSSTPLILPMDYMNELQDLHQKIMTLPDGEELQQVVEMIAATGCYEITSKTFDFDLCKLDRNTVQRLQDFFATSIS